MIRLRRELFENEHFRKLFRDQFNTELIELESTIPLQKEYPLVGPQEDYVDPIGSATMYWWLKGASGIMQACVSKLTGREIKMTAVCH